MAFYILGLAVDSANPQNIVVSASLSAQQAHYIENAESFVYRRSADSESWKVVSKGLPESKGTIITILAANPNNAGEFYAINNRGIFSSTDLVFLGQHSIFLGPKNIFYNILFLLQ
ncbi:MAG: hypothetical protein ACRD6U_06640 [Nitrososphaeraceae archaeon]